MKHSMRRPVKYILAGILTSMAAVSMIFFPSLVLESARQGIALWAGSVLPALLPFFICADFMMSLGVPSFVGTLFERPFRNLFGTPGSSAFVFIVSITSGYPMGARIIGQLRRRGEITNNEGIRMLSFCSTSGPLFMLGTVGAGMFHSAAAGALVALSHYAGAVLNGLLFRLSAKKARGGRRISDSPYHESAVDRKSLSEMLTDAILSSLKVLGIICCYIIIFTYAANMLEYTGILEPFKNRYSTGFLKGLLEMTVGINEIAMSEEAGLRTKCTIAAFLVSFGGLSVYGQSLGVLGGLTIHPLTYLKVKLSHGVFAAALAYFSAPVFLNRAVQKVGFFQDFKGDFQPGFLMQLLFSTRMLIIIMILFLLTIPLDYFLSRKEPPG